MTHTLLLIAIFWAIFFTVTLFTHYVYNVRMWGPAPFGYLDKYPFKCYKCFTTWALISTYIMAGILLADVSFTFFGITLGGLFGFGLHKDEKERFKIDEDD